MKTSSLSLKDLGHRLRLFFNPAARAQTPAQALGYKLVEMLNDPNCNEKDAVFLAKYADLNVCGVDRVTAPMLAAINGFKEVSAVIHDRTVGASTCANPYKLDGYHA